MAKFLKEIKISGFKSFADKTSIQFKEGFNMIVGPNGCGKSNIIDAFCWGLGENKLKTLRASSPSDILFAGNEKRPSSPVASVSFVIDNHDQILKMDSALVSIKRSLSKDGESHYFINEQACRLKDLQQLFMDTGVGKNGYSIMQQGRIDQIIMGKPSERRQIFEEASGISFSKNLVRESEQKLAKTVENIQRLTDILKEIEGQVDILKIQAEQAKIYKSLKQKIEKNQRKILVMKYLDINNQMKVKKEKENILLEEMNLLKQKVATLEQEGGENFEEIAQCEEQIQIQDELKQKCLISEAKTGQKIELIRHNHKQLTSEYEKLEKQITLLLKEQTTRQELINRLSQEKEVIENKQKNFAKEKQTQIQKIENLNEQLQKTKQSLEEKNQLIADKEIFLQNKLLAEQEKLISFVDSWDVNFLDITTDFVLKSQSYQSLQSLLTHMIHDSLIEKLKKNLHEIKLDEALHKLEEWSQSILRIKDLISLFEKEVTKSYQDFQQQNKISVPLFQENQDLLNQDIQTLQKEKETFVHMMKDLEIEKNELLDQYEQQFLTPSDLKNNDFKISVQLAKAKEEFLFYASQINSCQEDTQHFLDKKNHLEEEIYLLVEEYEQIQSEKEKILFKVNEMRQEIHHKTSLAQKMKLQKEELIKTIAQAAERVNNCYLEGRELAIQQDIFAKEFQEHYHFSVIQFLEENSDEVSEILSSHNDVNSYQRQGSQLKKQFEEMGLVNLLAIVEFEEVSQRYEYLKTNQEDLIKGQKDLQQLIETINKQAVIDFTNVFHQVNENLKQVFIQAFEGGSCHMSLTSPEDPLESGIEIRVQLPGKKLQNLALLSGGEKTMVALSVMFSLFMVKPSPFCLLDEVDAALDEVNVRRFLRILEKFKSKVQFLIITHNRITAQKGDIFYGVTMQETGVTKVFSFKPDNSNNSTKIA